VPFKSILVALDFREGSMEIVERALSMAHGDSRITVVLGTYGGECRRSSQPTQRRHGGSMRALSQAIQPQPLHAFS
jgi:hypothetical protein